ncbi:MAG TPA: MMPL family transporter [Solirubrobacterales bacterium]|nr:MMPL family transporter [Solirubrobacterales bacterium]
MIKGTLQGAGPQMEWPLPLRHPRLVVALTVAVALAGGAAGRSAPEEMSYRAGDFYSHDSESFRAEDELERNRPEGSRGPPDVAVIVAGPPRTAGAGMAKRLRRDPLVAAVAHHVFASRDRASSYVLAWVKPREGREAAAAEVAREVEGPDAIVGGELLSRREFKSQISEDLRRAQLIALPLLLLLGFWVFRSAVAAFLPVAVGGVALLVTLGLLRIVTGLVPLSVFSLDIALALALGLGVDYSLLMVSRFREGLADGAGPRGSARTTIRTAGRTVALSSAAIGLCFCALFVIPVPFVRSVAFAGGSVAIVTGLSALVLLPALLLLLGPRVNALAPRRWQRPAERTGEGRGGSAWYRIALHATRRPRLVAAVTGALFVLMALPAFSMRFVGLDATSLPTSSHARQFVEQARREFDNPFVGEISIAIHGDESEAVNAWGRVNAMAERTGLGIAFPALSKRSAALWEMRLNPTEPLFSEKTRDLVSRLRRMTAPVAVAGNTAAYLDSAAALERRLPLALAIVAFSSLLFVFLATGSLVLPLKALLMNALSIGAALGLTVAVFQAGRLEGVLDYSSQHALMVALPFVVVAAAFGLLTDYGLFLFARVQEERERGADDRQAVALGVERTGRVITAAALLFCVAVGAFSTSGLLLLKTGAVAIVLTVALDAFLVRPLLVPSLMTLLGRWNWWPRRMPTPANDQ